MSTDHTHTPARTYDWSPLERDDVRGLVARVADKAARRFHWMERADLEQDAALILASTPCLAARAAADELGLLFHELYCDVVDKFKAAATALAQREDDMARLDERVETVDGNGVSRHELLAMPDEPQPSYGPGALVAGLRAWWIGAKSCNQAVLAVDAEWAWARAGLSKVERRAIVLVIGLDYTYVHAGGMVDRDESSVRAACRRGLRRLLLALGGATEANRTFTLTDSRSRGIGSDLSGGDNATAA